MKTVAFPFAFYSFSILFVPRIFSSRSQPPRRRPDAPARLNPGPPRLSDVDDESRPRSSKDLGGKPAKTSAGKKVPPRRLSDRSAAVIPAEQMKNDLCDVGLNAVCEVVVQWCSKLRGRLKAVFFGAVQLHHEVEKEEVPSRPGSSSVPLRRESICAGSILQTRLLFSVIRDVLYLTFDKYN